eukprot:762473-Hanusia_phi.AAC.2
MVYASDEGRKNRELGVKRFHRSHLALPSSNLSTWHSPISSAQFRKNWTSPPPVSPYLSNVDLYCTMLSAYTPTSLSLQTSTLLTRKLQMSLSEAVRPSVPHQEAARELPMSFPWARTRAYSSY